MKTIPEKLETLFDKVRALLEERQQAAAEALSEIASETYTLSEDELGALRPALQRAQRGEYADETAISGDRRRLPAAAGLLCGPRPADHYERDVRLRDSEPLRQS